MSPAGDHSFLARYGAVILRGGIAAIPTSLYKYQAGLKLSPQQVWFVSAILARKWDADMPHPSLKRLAAETGVSEQQLHNYKRELVAAGWLRIVNRQTIHGGKDSNYYDFSPLFHRLEDLLTQDSAENKGGYLNPSLATHLNGNFATQLNPSGATHLNPGLALIESVEEEAKTKESLGNSNSPNFGYVNVPLLPLTEEQPVATLPQPTVSLRGRPPKPTPAIDQLIRQITAEFHDDGNERSNVTRGMRLYRASDLSEEAFLAVLYEARKLAKSRGNIQKVAQDLAPLKNRMPFFFAVVQDLLTKGEPPATQDQLEQNPQKPEPEPLQAHPNDVLWQKVLADLAQSMSKDSFNSHLRNTRLVAFDGAAATIASQSSQQMEWLRHSLKKRIEDSLRYITGSPITTTFTVESQS